MQIGLGLAVTHPRPAVAPAASDDFVQVTTRGMVYQNREGPSGANVTGETLQYQVIGRGGAKFIQLGYAAWWTDAATPPAEAAVGNDYPIRASIQSAQTGQIVNATYNAQSPWTVVNDTVLMLADPIYPQDLGMTSFDEGDGFWVGSSTTLVAGQFWPYGQFCKTPGEFQARHNPASPQTGSPTPWTLSAGGSVRRSVTSLCALGAPNNPSQALPVVFIGDSLANGNSDADDIVVGDIGFVTGCYDVGGTTLPYLKIADGGDRVAAFLAGCTRRQELLPYGKLFVIWMGTNDLQAGGATAETVRDNLRSLSALIKTMRPDAKILILKLPPRVTSTNSYIDASGQTPITNFATGGRRDTLNGYLDADIGTYWDRVWDPNAYFEDQANHGKWVSTGAANYATSDGVHPSTALYDLAMPHFKTELAACVALYAT